MKINGFVWLQFYVEKLAAKHGVETQEVEEVLLDKPFLRRFTKGRHPGEDLYHAYGQTVTGRYLFVVFIRKIDATVLVISARDMTERERKQLRNRK